MLTRFVRGQLLAFAVVTVLVLGYVAVSVVRLPAMVGIGRYPVTLTLPEAAGLYPNAVVTYRGVDVGKVTGLRVEDSDVAVDLSIDAGVEIPADSVAEVRSVSAIGEQYVNFEPQGASTAVLRSGDVVPVGQARLPVDEHQLLDSTKALLDSVPLHSLATTVDELHEGFDGVDGDVGRLLDSLTALQREADANLGPTKRLVADLEPVLRTQQAVGGDVRSWARDLAAVTSTVVDKDAALRGIVAQGPGTAEQLTGVFDDMRPTLPVLVANLATTAQVTTAYLPGIEHLLIVLPAAIEQVQTIVPPDQVPSDYMRATLDFKVNVNSPPVCTVGFPEAGKHRDPNDLSPAALPEDSYCKVAPDDPRVVRGTRNLPCPNDPDRRGPLAADCGLVFDRVTVPDAPPAAQSVADPATAVYDPADGRVMTPGGGFFQLGQLVSGKPVPKTWQDLLLGTVTS